MKTSGAKNSLFIVFIGDRMKKILLSSLVISITSLCSAEQPLLLNKEAPVELNTIISLNSKPIITTSTDTLLNVDIVFGVKLGQERDKAKFPSCSSLVGLTSTCYSSYPFKRVVLARKEAPNYVKDNIVYVTEIDNKIEKIQVLTNGYQDQEKVFKVLVEKYGKPSNYWTSKSSNAFGRVVDSMQAIWSFGDIEVIFVGISNRIDKGGIGFTTKKFREYEAQQQLSKKSKERPL